MQHSKRQVIYLPWRIKEIDGDHLFQISGQWRVNIFINTRRDLVFFLPTKPKIKVKWKRNSK